MSEHLGLLNFRERMEAMRETEEKRKEWEANEKSKAELARVEAERAEMEAHLRRRGERFVEMTGEQPSRTLLEGWRDEFATGKVAAEEAERQTRYDQAAREDDLF